MRSLILFSFVSAIVSVAALTGGCDSNDSSDPPIQYTDEGDVAGSAPIPFTATTVPVLVTNTTAQAVPTKAIGTTTVTGAVTASQAGNWNVSVDGGTVAASQSGPWSVGAAQEGEWSVGAKQQGPWTVDIGSSPPVALAPGSSVSVGSLPPVTIAGVPAVNIANTPAVTIASMPAVAVSGTVLVGNTEDDEAIPVRNVGSEATQTPWVLDGQMIIDPGSFSTSQGFFAVPDGKRLVIEYMTLRAVLPAGQVVIHATLQAIAAGESASLWFPMQPVANISTTSDVFATAQLTRVNVDGAVIVSVSRNGPTGPIGQGIVDVGFSGYLVDAN